MDARIYQFWVKLDDLSVWLDINEDLLGEYFFITSPADLHTNFEVKQIIKIREAIRGYPDPNDETLTKKTLVRQTYNDWVEKNKE